MTRASIKHQLEKVEELILNFELLAKVHPQEEVYRSTLVKLHGSRAELTSKLGNRKRK